MEAASANVFDALQSVHDPCCAERGISVVDMGLIRSIEVDDFKARVELMLTSGWCPFASKVVASVKKTIEDLPDIERAEVEITWDEAWTMDRMSDDARSKLVFLPEPIAVSNRDRYIAAHSQPVAESPRGDRK